MGSCGCVRTLRSPAGLLLLQSLKGCVILPYKLPFTNYTLPVWWNNIKIKLCCYLLTIRNFTYNISKQRQSIPNCWILRTSNMSRVEIHLFVLSFALIGGIEPCKSCSPHVDFNNVGWEPLERVNFTPCEIELMTPFRTTTRLEK